MRLLALGDRNPDFLTHREIDATLRLLPADVDLDTLGGLWAQGMLADKVYAGFTSSQTAHGGQETTLLNLYTTLMHFGGIVVAPGYTDPTKFVDGNPYGVGHITGPENQNPLDKATLNALDHLGRRVISVADRLNA